MVRSYGLGSGMWMPPHFILHFLTLFYSLIFLDIAVLDDAIILWGEMILG